MQEKGCNGVIPFCLVMPPPLVSKLLPTLNRFCHMTIQAGQLPEEVWWVPYATSQVAQKSKFQQLFYLQITDWLIEDIH